jgi:tRNA(Arg) A34 adenosine deaminase TadA
MTTSMPRSLGRRRVLRQGAISIGAGGAMSLLGEARAGAQPSSSPHSKPSAGLPLHPDFPTSPRSALPRPVRENLDAAMRRAIEVAHPLDQSFGYGAVLVDTATGKFVAEAANTGRATDDPSAHAELNVLRKFSIENKNFIAAATTVLVSTAEPCPMCATCAVFARVAGVAYGTSLEFLMAQPNNKVPRISMPQVVATGPLTAPPDNPKTRMPVVGGVLHEETDRLFKK